MVEPSMDVKFWEGGGFTSFKATYSDSGTSVDVHDIGGPNAVGKI